MFTEHIKSFLVLYWFHQNVGKSFMIQNPADIEEFPDQEYSTTFERLVTPQFNK